MREKFPVIHLRSSGGRSVARDGIVLCFFMRRSHHEVAPAVSRALQAYRRATPPQSLDWYGSDDGDTLLLDDKGWELIRWQMLERPWGAACGVDLEENPSEVGGYHFEYRGRQLADPNFSHEEDATSGVSFTFPTEYLYHPDRVAGGHRHRQEVPPSPILRAGAPAGALLLRGAHRLVLPRQGAAAPLDAQALPIISRSARRGPPHASPPGRAAAGTPLP
jgi:hypothetical protein